MNREPGAYFPRPAEVISLGPMKIHRLYADDKGESHWEDVEVEFAERIHAGRLSKRLPATDDPLP